MYCDDDYDDDNDYDDDVADNVDKMIMLIK